MTQPNPPSNTIFGREPVLYLAVVQAGLALVLAFGLNLTNVEVGAILAFSAVVLGFISRSRVTPV